MKNLAIAINDILAYMSLFIIVGTGCGFLLFTNSIMLGLGIIFFGTIAWAVIYGFWFAVSGIYDELVKLNKKA